MVPPVGEGRRPGRPGRAHHRPPDHYLSALIDAGVLHADAAGAYAEEDRILDADAHTSPTVHPVTVVDLADEFTRLDPTDPATSCR